MNRYFQVILWEKIEAFRKLIYPLNERSKLKNLDYTINQDGLPCYPNDENLPMKPEGNPMRSQGSLSYEFVCPKTKWVYDKISKKQYRQCYCENPCISSGCSRMIYIQQDNNYKAYPGTEDWDNTYKLRTVVEREINHIKENLVSQVAVPRMRILYMLI